MDKKNTLIGVLMLAAGFFFLHQSSKMAPPPPAVPDITSPAPAPGSENVAPGAATSTLPARQPEDTTFAAVVSESSDASITVIENDFIALRLTNYGGAIRDVAIKAYPRTKGAEDPFVFNELHADPILAFTDFPGLGRATAYELVSATATQATFRTVFEDRIEVTRTYSLNPAESDGAKPYLVRHETRFRNLTAQTFPLPRAGFALGTAAPVSTNDTGIYLNVGAHDGDKVHYTDRSDLQGGGFLAFFGLKSSAPVPFIERTQSVTWATAKNQFFTSILIPDTPGVGIVTRRVELDPARGIIGITGAARFDLRPLAPDASETFGADLYLGPKEYNRLSTLPGEVDRVMQFDRYFFNKMFLSGYISPLLLKLMTGAHSIVPNWGIAIVLMTIFLKIITLPFTLAAAKSGKRMQKLAPQMKEIREKYKDNPQKQQQATMELFRSNRVNPVGGCVPILITIPLFVGFFVMLQSTAELRFQSFLWTADLSAPDTVWRIFGFPINIWPLIMGATMIFQMRLVPTPTVDNAQAKIFKFMPWIFTLICYNFSAALALYSSVNGIFTIGQQLVVNRMKDPEPVAPAAAPAGRSGKPVKNVTPTKKKKP